MINDYIYFKYDIEEEDQIEAMRREEIRGNQVVIQLSGKIEQIMNINSSLIDDTF